MPGGRASVLLGSDASREEWREGLLEAIKSAPENLYILQEYKKPARRKHPVFFAAGADTVDGGPRAPVPVLFCFSAIRRVSAGCWRRFCPADKKIIHGMRDAAMLPVRVAD